MVIKISNISGNIIHEVFSKPKLRRGMEKYANIVKDIPFDLTEGGRWIAENGDIQDRSNRTTLYMCCSPSGFLVHKSIGRHDT